jgi:hypothetical protein
VPVAFAFAAFILQNHFSVVATNRSKLSWSKSTVYGYGERRECDRSEEGRFFSVLFVGERKKQTMDEKYVEKKNTETRHNDICIPESECKDDDGDSEKNSNTEKRRTKQVVKFAHALNQKEQTREPRKQLGHKNTHSTCNSRCRH